MKVILIGPERPRMVDAMERAGDTVTVHTARLSAGWAFLKDTDFLVSHGYRYILKPDILERFENRAINLHISYLPWNRGADPNIWSFLENTPKGVSIHVMDKGLDTGPIIGQEEVVFEKDETLASSYDILSARVEELFIRLWPRIRLGDIESKVQPSGGSYHRMADRHKVAHLLHSGWNTPVADLIGRSKEIEA